MILRTDRPPVVILEDDQLVVDQTMPQEPVIGPNPLHPEAGSANEEILPLEGNDVLQGEDSE